jgi:hypothetical protein
MESLKELVENKKEIKEKQKFVEDLLENHIAFEDVLSDPKTILELTNQIVDFENSLTRFGLDKDPNVKYKKAQSLLENSIIKKDINGIIENLYALTENFIEIQNEIQAGLIGENLKSIQKDFLIENFKFKKPIMLKEAIFSIEQIRKILFSCSDLSLPRFLRKSC